ncbi:hypothetical protein FHT09_001647 [Xanthomonas arboricola]|uniref:hypothetical protein n=1 Tax=Xanthomonas TaxID=338 RepID=UPI000CEE2B8C|nr:MULTISPECIES: hypothetical protein [Xanthomonas]MBB5735907.1 hypothetical protein [Xanthomonas sp. CFBP 8152]PPT81629.1 hypothetical protein XarbCFBP8152_01155 [Xanthomonas arboricola]
MRTDNDTCVHLSAWELSSPAHRALDPVARALLVELRALNRPGHASEVFLSVRQARQRLCGIGQAKVQAAFKALRENRWIEYADAAGPGTVGLPRKIWLRSLLPDGSTEPYADHVPAGM